MNLSETCGLSIDGTPVAVRSILLNEESAGLSRRLFDLFSEPLAQTATETPETALIAQQDVALLEPAGDCDVGRIISIMRTAGVRPN